MNHSFHRVGGKSSAFLVSAAIISLLLFHACKKDDTGNHGNQVSKYSSEVLDKWMTMQIRLMKNSTGIPNQSISRQYAYTGIAAMESVAPGLPNSFNSLRKWNGLTGLPAASQGFNYYYPANLNAAMAEINRLVFPNANASDKAAIDSLENALKQEFLSTQQQNLVNTSSLFGKAVAAAVYAWSETDGYKNAGNPYTPPAGPGLWKPTPPAHANASIPYWGNNRPVVAGSLNNAEVAVPTAYSTEPGSAFYQMVKQVYDASQALTDDQKAMSIFWRDVPGVTSPGHWLSITQMAIKKTNAKLDKAVLAYALSGAGINDALISCFKAKYQYSLVRPITYIREVIGQDSWNSQLGTPPHPEYPSAHSSLSAAAGAVLEKIFGNIGGITDHTYDYLGMPARTYPSFIAIAEEAGKSRVYAGIHYQQSVDAGLIQGKKVAENIIGNNYKD